MKKKQHGGPRKGAGMKAKDAEGKLEQCRLSLDKPTITRAEEIGHGNKSLGVRIAVKAYPEKKERR